MKFCRLIYEFPLTASSQNKFSWSRGHKQTARRAMIIFRRVKSFCIIKSWVLACSRLRLLQFGV